MHSPAWDRGRELGRKGLLRLLWLRGEMRLEREQWVSGDYDRLRDMESEGLVQVANRDADSVTYRLTDRGRREAMDQP